MNDVSINIAYLFTLELFFILSSSVFLELCRRVKNAEWFGYYVICLIVSLSLTLYNFGLTAVLLLLK